MKQQSLLRDTGGATVVEMAFALPTFIVLLWSMVQLGLVYRANSGIQHALGQGARYATLYPTPTDDDIDDRMDEAVYGIGPGTFNTFVDDVPAEGYKDLRVTYTQPTDFIFFQGPTINLTKTKRVWVAGAVRGGGGGATPSPAPSPGPAPAPGPSPSPEPSPTPTPTPTPTPEPTPTPTPTPGNGNGNNTVCKNPNPKKCQ